MKDDPLSFFKELRAKQPVLVLPECTLVARYEDVIEMLNMPKVFTVALYEPKMSQGYLMMHDDDALHSREKSIMRGLLNRDDLPQVRKMVTEISQKILREAGGRIDAMTGYCRLVPATIVRDYFGLIGMDRKDLIEWSYWAQADTFYNQPFDIATPEERKRIVDSHNASGEKLGKYVAALVLTRTLAVKFSFLTAPFKKLWRKITGNNEGFHDDIVSRMLRTKFPSEVQFDIKRAGVNAGGLLIGAIETTAQATVQTMDYLLKRPQILTQAINAARLEDTSAFDAIVWEALRFVPISAYVFRQTSTEYTIARGTERETRIPARTNVLALTQSAMFDEKAFEDPEEFRAGRNWYHYFTFGYGAHECLGKYVGMVMIPEMVRQVLLQPGLAAKGDIVYDGHLPSSYELSWKA
jgi:cytochrome P450